MNEVIAINNYFNERNEARIIYFVRENEMKTNDGILMDTYMERRKNLYYVRLVDFVSQKDGNSIKISDTELHEDLFKNIYKNADRIDYIIIKTDTVSDDRKFLNAEIVPELSGKHFTVYKNLNPSVIQFED